MVHDASAGVMYGVRPLTRQTIGARAEAPGPRWPNDVAPFVSGGQCASRPTLARSGVASSTDQRMSGCRESRTLACCTD